MASQPVSLCSRQEKQGVFENVSLQLSSCVMVKYSLNPQPDSINIVLNTGAK